MPRFQTRDDAGTELALALPPSALIDPVVVAIPKGGVPVGMAVARALGAPLIVADVHEVTANRPDLAVGAVTSKSDELVYRSTALALGLTHRSLDTRVSTLRGELAELHARLTPLEPKVSMGGHTAIVVDDGLLATTAFAAAAEQLLNQGATRLVLAVPVGVEHFLRVLDAVYDDVFALERHAGYTNLTDYYAHLPPVSIDDIVAMLRPNGA